MKSKILTLICLSALGAACVFGGCQSSQTDNKTENGAKNAPIVRTQENGEMTPETPAMPEFPECPDCPQSPARPEGMQGKAPFPFQHREIFRRPPRGNEAPPAPEQSPEEPDASNQSVKTREKDAQNAQDGRKTDGKRDRKKARAGRSAITLIMKRPVKPMPMFEKNQTEQQVEGEIPQDTDGKATEKAENN